MTRRSIVRRSTGLMAVLAVLAMLAAACSDTAATTSTTVPGTTTPTSSASTTSVPATTGPTTSTTATTTTLEPATTTTGEAGDEPTAPVGSFRVRGVAADDVLNVRRGAGVGNAIVATLPPNAIGVRTTGVAEPTPDGGTWWEIELFDGQGTGWVNAAFLREADAAPCFNDDGMLEGAHVFVAAPRAGARVASGFALLGCSRTFESTFGWRLLDEDGTVVADGFGMGGGVDGPGTFALTVDYQGIAERQPGILEVFEDDVSDGEGPPPIRNAIPLFLTPDGGPEPVNPLDACSDPDGALDGAFGIIATAPFSGQRVVSGFRLEGCSNTFEAAVPWELLDREGRVIAEGFTMGGGVDFQPFGDTVDFTVTEPQIGMLIVNEEEIGEGPPPSRNEIPVVLSPPGPDSATDS